MEQRGTWKRVLAIGIATLVGAGIAAGLIRRGGDDATLALEPVTAALDGTAPIGAITGPDLESGARIDIARFRGKPVFINAWASWCGPCRDEAPDLRAFAQEHPEVVMLGIDVNDDRARGRTFSDELGWTWPSIYDPEGVVALDRLKIANLPATLYVDAKGILRGRTNGPVTLAELEDVAARID